MPRYHVVKATEPYWGKGYEGHSAQQCGYEGRLEFDELRKARVATVHLEAYNPVGWCVYDHTTGELVFGLNQYDSSRHRWRPTNLEPKAMKNKPTQQPIMCEIRDLRRGMKRRQEDVAAAAEISREAYLRAESGTSDPRLSTVVAAAKALGYELALVPIKRASVSVVPAASEPAAA